MEPENNTSSLQVIVSVFFLLCTAQFKLSDPIKRSNLNRWYFATCVIFLKAQSGKEIPIRVKKTNYLLLFSIIDLKIVYILYCRNYTVSNKLSINYERDWVQEVVVIHKPCYYLVVISSSTCVGQNKLVGVEKIKTNQTQSSIKVLKRKKIIQ